MNEHRATEQAFKNGYKKGYEKGKQEVAVEIFEEILRTIFSKIPNKIMLINQERDFSDGVIFGQREAFFDMVNNLAELKKKYTEGGGENGT